MLDCVVMSPEPASFRHAPGVTLRPSPTVGDIIPSRLFIGFERQQTLVGGVSMGQRTDSGKEAGRLRCMFSDRTGSVPQRGLDLSHSVRMLEVERKARGDGNGRGRNPGLS